MNWPRKTWSNSCSVRPLAGSSAVDEAECFGEVGFEPELVLQTFPCGGGRVVGLVGAGVAAAGVGPEPAEVILRHAPLLEQHLAVAIEDKDRKSPVQAAAVLMGGELAH